MDSRPRRDISVKKAIETRSLRTQVYEYLKVMMRDGRLSPGGFLDLNALAAELGALSADHLGHISRAGIGALARSDTVGVLIPGSLFFVPGEKAAPVREMIDAGVAIGLSTDYTPGTSPVVSMPVAITLAMVLLHLTAAEALAAATINGAAALGMADRVGSLEPGKQADLVIYEARDYREIPYRFGENLVRRVLVKGRTIVERPAVGPL